MSLNNLYVCNDYRLFVFETKIDAYINSYCGTIYIGYTQAEEECEYRSRHLGGNKVTYMEAGEPILLINKDVEAKTFELWHVLVGERVGWIVVQERTKVISLERPV